MFSIIIATLNEENTIEGTIKSVLDQSILVDKIIIKDGGSLDDTVNRARRLIRGNDLILSLKDNGLYDAWNQALEHIESSWIIFLGSGDTLSKDALITYRDYLMERNHRPDIVTSRIEKVSGTGKSLGTYYGPWSWNKFRRHMCTSHVGALHSAELFREVGFFNTDYKICSDYELFLRKGSELNAGFVDRVQANMLAGGMSQSIEALKETAQIKNKLKSTSKLTCNLDFYLACVKFYLRKLIQNA